MKQCKIYVVNHCLIPANCFHFDVSVVGVVYYELLIVLFSVVYYILITYLFIYIIFL